MQKRTTRKKQPAKTPAKKETSLEVEAEKFVKQKTEQKNTSQRLTARRYLAGMALSGLLARTSYARQEELVREAYKWADAMLEED